MATGRSKGGAAASSSVDVSQHPGYVNLGNTCFLNSTLQAISATQSLKELYQPNESALLYELQSARGRTPARTPDPSSRRASFVSELVNARGKSPVLRLADEEHGRSFGQAITRPTSTSIDAASINAIAQHAVSNPTPADVQSIQRSEAHFVPRSSDLPLNTAFRQVLEKSWESARSPSNSDAKANKSNAGPSKVSAVNPKPLLNEMSTKYDQYGEYRQQDGHELLRHLLDSLRMEELDVIRKIQPPREKSGKGQRSKQDPYVGSSQGEEQLKPLVDNLFCGKLLSFVVCESCRHVSHTYEDFYDISLSLRPDAESKESSKRQRIRNMADRWRQRKPETNETSKPLQESLAMLRDGNMGSLSDTEQSDDPVRRSHSRIGRGIARPKSSADSAKVDANSKEGAKTFIKRQMQQTESDMEGLSLEEKRAPSGQMGGALLRAVSGRRTPISRTSSPFRGRERVDSDDAEKEKHVSQRRHLSPLHRHKKKPGRHAVYLAKLLAEAPQQPQQNNIGALFWGRRTPLINATETTNEKNHHHQNANGVEAQQANTGLVRALHHFTSVEVLDGPNSFACKRCWRIVNPPTNTEREKLELRRLRRGKDADESEMSSDDDSSSDEEAKEEQQKADLRKKSDRLVATQNKSSASSTTSLSDGFATDMSRKASADGSASAASAAVEHMKADATISASPESHKDVSSSVLPKASADLDDTTTNVRAKAKPIVVVRSATDGAPPILQAPKAILAAPGSLTLSSATNASSDEGSAGPLTDDDESDADEGKGVNGRRIRYADEGGSTITKPATLEVKSSQQVRKRSTHSIPRRALKRFLIAETPKVLVFHFKRFQATGRGFSFATSFRKIDDPITFPQFLDVSPWMAPPREEYDRLGRLKKSSDPRALTAYQSEIASEIEEKGHHHHLWGWRGHHHGHEKDSQQAKLPYQSSAPSTNYRLYAVVVHQGSMSGGHYTAYVLSDRASESLKALAKQSTSRKSSPTPRAVSGAKSNVARMAANESATESTSAGDVESTTTTTITTPATSIAPGSVGSSATKFSSSTNAAPSPAGVSSSTTRVDALGSVSSLGSDLGDAGIVSLDVGDANGLGIDDAQTPVPHKSEERRWIYASDTLVRSATVEEVLKAQAYMLFYEQMP